MSFWYPDGKCAIKGLSLILPRGRCLAVLGANGSGKSTLLYLLAGVYPQVLDGKLDGRIEVLGFPPASAPADSLVRAVCLVQQDPDAGLVTTTVAAEFEFGAANLDIDPKETRCRIASLVQTFGFIGMETRQTATLSYGQKQRLAIASAMVTGAKVILLDEPFCNLDQLMQVRLVEVLRQLKMRGCTIVLAAHELSNLTDFVDDVLILGQDGRPLSFTSVDRALRDVALLRVAGIRLPTRMLITDSLGLPPPLDFTEFCDCLAGYCRKESASGRIPRIRVPFGGPPQEVASGPGEPLFRIEGVTIGYPELPGALSSLTCQISEGETLVIIGRNGAGKTTLIRALVGLVRPTSGQIFYRGADVATRTVGQMATEIGVVIQNPDHQLLYADTVFSEIAYALRLQGLAHDIVAHRVHDALTRVGLDGMEGAFPGKLSLGQRKKLVLACTVARHPKVLILDEPFFGLDAHGREDLVGIARSVVQDGQTVILVTHDVDAVMDVASRFLVLHEGRAILDDAAFLSLTAERLQGTGVDEPELLRAARVLRARKIPLELVGTAARARDVGLDAR